MAPLFWGIWFIFKVVGKGVIRGVRVVSSSRVWFGQASGKDVPLLEKTS